MKYNRKPAQFFFSALLSAMLFLCLCTGAAHGQTLTCIVPDGQYVNVRNRPSADAAIWGVMHNGDLIETDPAEIDNGFFKTTFDGRIAYVSVRFFEIEADGEYMVDANGRVRVRKSPGGAAAGFVKPGTTLRVTAWRYGADGSLWAQYQGGKYVCAQYLRAIN